MTSNLQQSVLYIKENALTTESDGLLGRLWRFVSSSSSTVSEGKLLECVERIGRLIAFHGQDFVEKSAPLPQLLATNGVILKHKGEARALSLFFEEVHTMTEIRLGQRLKGRPLTKADVDLFLLRLVAPYTRHHKNLDLDSLLRHYEHDRSKDGAILRGSPYEIFLADVLDSGGEDAADCLTGIALTMDFFDKNSPSSLYKELAEKCPTAVGEEALLARCGHGQQQHVTHTLRVVNVLRAGSMGLCGVNFDVKRDEMRTKMACTELALRSLARSWSLEVKECPLDIFYRLSALYMPVENDGKEIRTKRKKHVRPTPPYGQESSLGRRAVVDDEKARLDAFNKRLLLLSVGSRVGYTYDLFWTCQQLMQHRTVHGHVRTFLPETDRVNNWPSTWHSVQVNPEKRKAVREWLSKLKGEKRSLLCVKILEEGLEEFLPLPPCPDNVFGAFSSTPVALRDREDLYFAHYRELEDEKRVRLCVDSVAKVVDRGFRPDTNMSLPRDPTPTQILRTLWFNNPYLLSTAALGCVVGCLAPLAPHPERAYAVADCLVGGRCGTDLFSGENPLCEIDESFQELLWRMENCLPPLHPLAEGQVGAVSQLGASELARFIHTRPARFSALKTDWNLFWPALLFLRHEEGDV